MFLQIEWCNKNIKILLNNLSLLCNQYLIDFPRTPATIRARRGMDATSSSKYWSGKEFHISVMIVNSSVEFLGILGSFRKRFFINPHTFSMRLRSGLWAGHFMRSIPISDRYLAIDLALCGPQLSSWRIKLLLLPCFSSMNGSKCSLITFRYVVCVKAPE